MAKTCHLSAEMCRTQHGIFAVSPSEGRTSGLRYVARRVSPSGNCVSCPKVTHAKSALISLFRAGAKMYPMIGTENSVAATALIPIPRIISMFRREIALGGEVVVPSPVDWWSICSGISMVLSICEVTLCWRMVDQDRRRALRPTRRLDRSPLAALSHGLEHTRANPDAAG